MSDKILIPSELLEPVITKTIADIFSWYASDPKLSYRDVGKMLNALSMFARNCNATHCSIAISNIQGKISILDGHQKKLRGTFKRVLINHYTPPKPRKMNRVNPTSKQ